MNSHISTYKELLSEKERLERSLNTQKQLVRLDINTLKSQFKPVSELSHGINGYAAAPKTNILFTILADEAAMLILKKIIIARSGWLGKIILPPFFRRFTSNFLKEQVKLFFDRLKSIVKSNTPLVAENRP